jgi:hypothetical protein
MAEKGGTKIRILKNNVDANVDPTTCLVVINIIFTIGLIISVLLKRAKKKLASLPIIISILIIISIVVSYYFLILSPLIIREDDNKYEYSIRIATNGTNQFTIYVPIPIEIRDDKITISKMVEKIIVIYGNATFSLIETNKGKALNITFKGNCYLRVSGTKKFENWKDEKYDYDILSLQNTSDINDYHKGHDDVPYWIWCNGIENHEIIFIEIQAFFGNNNSQNNSKVEGTITNNDWQILYGSQEHWIT